MSKLPKADRTLQDWGFTRKAIVARVGVSVKGFVVITFRNPEGDECFNISIDRKDAQRLVDCIPECLAAFDGQNN